MSLWKLYYFLYLFLVLVLRHFLPGWLTNFGQANTGSSPAWGSSKTATILGPVWVKFLFCAGLCVTCLTLVAGTGLCHFVTLLLGHSLPAWVTQKRTYRLCHFAALFLGHSLSGRVTQKNKYRLCHFLAVFLIFAKYLSTYLHIFTCTYRGTRTQAHMYNQHTNGMETTRHRSMVERDGRKAFFSDKDLAQKKRSEKTDIHECQEKFRAHRASSKNTRLFLTK